MAMQYHEPPEELSNEAREWHRAIRSLMEELEAIDWYHHRIDVCQDEDLKGILQHNMDEEAEHAAITLEWLRRKYPKLDKELREYLFTDKPVTELAKEEDNDEDNEPSNADSIKLQQLGIGDLRKGAQ